MNAASYPGVILTCAVTGGSAGILDKHPGVPVTPEQIAADAIAAARAGAAIAHIHVRDPGTGRPSNDLALYREVVQRIRADATDVVINLTTGAGTNLVIDEANPRIAGAGSTLLPVEERVRHVAALRPELCTLDLGSLNYGDAVCVNTPYAVRFLAQHIRAAGVRPELEIFDTGGLQEALTLLEEGLVERPALVQLCLGVPGGAPASARQLLHMVGLLPPDTEWAAFGVSRWEFPILAHAFLLGGHVRVGLEDNVYLSRGRLATNVELVRRARELIELLGGRLLSPRETRERLRLAAPADAALRVSDA